MSTERQDRLDIVETVQNWALWRDAGDWERFRGVWHRIVNMDTDAVGLQFVDHVDHPRIADVGAVFLEGQSQHVDARALDSFGSGATQAGYLSRIGTEYSPRPRCPQPGSDPGRRFCVLRRLAAAHACGKYHELRTHARCAKFNGKQLEWLLMILSALAARCVRVTRTRYTSPCHWLSWPCSTGSPHCPESSDRLFARRRARLGDPCRIATRCSVTRVRDRAAHLAAFQRALSDGLLN